VALLCSGIAHAKTDLASRPIIPTALKSTFASRDSGRPGAATLQRNPSNANSGGGMTGFQNERQKDSRVRKFSFSPVFEGGVTGGIMTFAW
jgi:hypothetical protein